MQPQALFFGLADGRIVMGHLGSHQTTTLYQAQAAAVALAVDPRGEAVVSAHRDGSLWRLDMPRPLATAAAEAGGEAKAVSSSSPVLLAKHPCLPTGLAFCRAPQGVGRSALLVAGKDGQLRVYDARSGRALQSLDTTGEKNDYCLSFAAAGPLLAVGGIGAIRLLEQEPSSGQWRLSGTYVIPGLILPTSLAWQPGGRQLAVGALCGAVDLLECTDDGAPSSTVAATAAAAVAEDSDDDHALFQRAKALGYERGIQLLQAQGKLEAAVNTALAARNFEYALRVCDLSLPRRLAEAHGMHARCLEGKGRYAEAEAAFLRAKDPKGAVDMYLRLGDYAAAGRLAETHAPAALPAVMAAKADALLRRKQQEGQGEVDEEEARLAQAEALYLRAGQFEQAVQVYVESKAWAGAFRVAQRHCPWRLGEVIAAYEKGASSSGSSGDSGSDGGKARQYHDDALTRAYGRRVDGAQHDRYVGQLLRALEIVGGKLWAWPAAWAMVRVEEEKGAGGSSGGIGAAAERARDRLVCVQLQRMIEAANCKEQEGEEQESPPLPLLRKALVLLQEKGAPCPVAEPLTGAVYKQLVMGLLGLTHEEEKMAAEEENEKDLIKAWRRLLYGVLVDQVDTRITSLGGKASTEAERAAHEFRDLFLALHYTHLRLTCSRCSFNSPALDDVACRVSLSALRYAGTYIPADKAFYHAGQALRRRAKALAEAEEQDKEKEASACRHLAFLCLNRYVDLVEAITDRDTSLVDPRPLAGCSALPSPSASALPTRQHVTDEGAREAVRTWVLGACAEIAGRTLIQREDMGGLTDALFAVPPVHERCAVTGYPLQPAGATVVGGGKGGPDGNGSRNNSSNEAWQPIMRANTAAWRAYVGVFGECPWTGTAAVGGRLKL